MSDSNTFLSIKKLLLSSSILLFRNHVFNLSLNTLDLFRKHKTQFLSMSFNDTEMAQIIEILVRDRGISSHSIDLALLYYPVLSTGIVGMVYSKCTQYWHVAIDTCVTLIA